MRRRAYLSRVFAADAAANAGFRCRCRLPRARCDATRAESAAYSSRQRPRNGTFRRVFTRPILSRHRRGRGEEKRKRLGRVRRNVSLVNLGAESARRKPTPTRRCSRCRADGMAIRIGRSRINFFLLFSLSFSLFFFFSLIYLFSRSSVRRNPRGLAIAAIACIVIVRSRASNAPSSERERALPRLSSLSAFGRSACFISAGGRTFYNKIVPTACRGRYFPLDFAATSYWRARARAHAAIYGACNTGARQEIAGIYRD